MIDCLKEFATYNINHVHLDLQNTGMNDEALLKAARFLRKSWSLQCVHLSGNPGISAQLADKLRDMLGSVPV